MIRLKLDLPEATVSYNETGTLLGCPVDHTPIQIKNYGMPFEIVGYVSKEEFIAYSLFSSARKFSVSEQISLLTSLGFRTVPYFENEEGQGNQLINLKNQYSRFNAYWISLPSGKEYKIPELAHINAVDWELGPDKALTLVATTDKGIFRVVDMKLLAYYQPGCTAKVWNGELQPMNTAPITCPSPTFCPKCNNPLKRVQIYPDLPLFYKCTNPVCDKMVLDKEPVPETAVEEEVMDSESFQAERTTEDVEESVHEDTVPSEVVEEATEVIPTVFVDTAKIDESTVNELVSAGKINVTDNIKTANFVLVKTKMAVSKSIRELSKSEDIPLLPISEIK